MLFTDITGRKKKKEARVGLGSSWSSSTHQRAGRSALNVLFPRATLEVTQCTPSPSAMGAWISELQPSSGLLPTTCFFNPCFHIESNLDLRTEKSYKLPKQKQTLSQHDGSFNFCKLHLGTLKKSQRCDVWRNDKESCDRWSHHSATIQAKYLPLGNNKQNTENTWAVFQHLLETLRKQHHLYRYLQDSCMQYSHIHLNILTYYVPYYTFIKYNTQF